MGVSVRVFGKEEEEAERERGEKKKGKGPRKTLCYSPLSSFKVSVAECAREPASRVTATSKFPPCAISLQELLTAAGESKQREAPGHHRQADGATPETHFREILPPFASTVDGVRQRAVVFGRRCKVSSATSCSSSRRRFLPASDHGCRLL